MNRGTNGMNVSLLKCKECGKVYAFEKLEPRDRHRCECGATLDRWSNYKGECDVEKMPNEPYRKDTAPQAKPTGLTKGITIEIDCKPTDSFNETMDKLREAQRLMLPVIEIDKTKALLFQCDRKFTQETIDRLKDVFDEALGIKCVILDGGTKITGVMQNKDDSVR